MSRTTTVRITSASFDTDGDKKLAANLAKKTVGQLYDVVHEPDEDPMDLLADTVSDHTGWCIFSIGGEIVEG